MNHPARMNDNSICRSFVFNLGIGCPAGCDSSIRNALCVPALKPSILFHGMRRFSAADRPKKRRSAVAEHSHIECICSACADTAHYANDSFACVAFSSENGERTIAFNAYFRSARTSCPFMGRTSSPPQTWDFAVNARM